MRSASKSSELAKRVLTNAAHPDFRVRIFLVLPQAAERTSEDILRRIRMIVGEEHTPTVVEPLARFALDLGVVDQVLCTTTADASSSVCPVLVVILAESKLGALALPVLGLSGLGGKESVQPREVKPVRNVL